MKLALELHNEDEAIQLMASLRARRRELERVINALNLDLEARGCLAIVNRLITRLDAHLAQQQSTRFVTERSGGATPTGELLDAAVAQQQCAGAPGQTSRFDSEQPLHLFFDESLSPEQLLERRA